MRTSRGRSWSLRGSKVPGKAAHIVLAFAAGERLVLGQVKVGEKTNEITAIPMLLDMIDVANAVVTIDAMGCQREIAAKILEKKGGYADAKVSRHETLDGDHGRIETRKYTVIHDVKWLNDRHKWPGLNGSVVVDSTVETGGRIVRETRLYITSSTLEADRLGPYVRGHWSIENSLHWIMDVSFKDDACRVRTDHAPANFTTIKHMVLNLLRRSKAKGSITMKRHVASWDEDYLEALLRG